MILKGSQRGGARQLAVHLLNEMDNDHVSLHELRGFVSTDLKGALGEAYAVSLGTQCKQFLFSLSLNPPKGADASLNDLVTAADLAEERLGLKNQPRAIIVHEKEGRRHAHAVWSRIDASEMKAVNLPFFKTRLAALSKELYLEHGWELPDGHKENGWKNPLNFTLAEWQQAKRLGLDPRELKALFADAWKHSDGLRAFKRALEERGYYLARGDRRGFVAVDIQGEVFSIARMTGVRTKDVAARLGSPDDLPSVQEITAQNARLMDQRMHQLLNEGRAAQKKALRPLMQERRSMVVAQREERARLKAAQDARRSEEMKARQARFRGGMRGLWDVLTGRAAQMRRENEAQALEAHHRDLAQRERLVMAQMEERRDVQQRVETLRRDQRRERMLTSRQISFLLKLERDERAPIVMRTVERTRGLEID